MKTRYCFHYEDYALGQNEALYARMSQKGWHLKKRGLYLSRFEKGACENRRYRIELASPGFLENDADLSQEQLDLYAGCGWKRVARMGYLHIFCAGEGNPAPEIHTDPKLQARTLRALTRSYIMGALMPLMVLAFMLLMYASMHGGGLATGLYLTFVEDPFVELFYAALLVGSVVNCIVGAVRLLLLKKRLKKGIAIDHTPPVNRERVWRSAQWAWVGVCLLFVGGIALQSLAWENGPLPTVADGPYVTLAQAGYSAPREVSPVTHSDARVHKQASFMAKKWGTYENLADGTWLYQDVYQMNSPQAAQQMARVLMAEATFAQIADAFAPVSVEGLDAAWQSPLEAIAVKGDLVAYFTSAQFSSDSALPVLQAWAEQ